MLGYGMVIVNCTTRRWKYKIKLFFILLVLKILLLPIITLDIFMDEEYAGFCYNLSEKSLWNMLCVLKVIQA